MQTRTKIGLALVAFVLLASTKARAGKVIVTDDLIRRIDPNVKQNYAGVLNPAMAAGAINTPRRIAAFLAQILHESGSFRFMREIASGEAYEGRADLGNTQPGDGPRYKGRGFIQITGRANYRQAGRDLGIPLEASPESAERPDFAARLAVWFWTTRKLNAKADVGDFVGITRAINGGTRGLESRTNLYDRAKTLLA